MAAPPTPTPPRLQQTLQSAVQAVRWTYSLFWQFCPQQGVLVWSDGYYNGAIKTRKTVQPMEVTAEEASLQRSQQLRELYDSLSVGEAEQPARRPSASLSPEDLTESEWFYLMCVSFTFPPGVGLPGKAYTRRQHVWLTGAHEVDSKVFSRAILAKSARIQTVMCIPLMDGVVELGTTERVQEDLSVVQQVKAFFSDHHRHPPPKPALSGHSTSDHPPQFHSSASMYAANHPATTSNANQANREADDDNDEDDEDVTNEEGGAESDSEAAAGQPNPPGQAQLVGGATSAAEPSELMQLEMSEDIRLGSPDDASNNLDSDFPVMTTGGMSIPANAMMGQHRRADSFTKAESTRRWPVIVHDPSLHPPPLPPQPPSSSGVPTLEELTEEDTHYSQTVSAILQHQATRWPSETTLATTATATASGYLTCSAAQSAFSKWSSRLDHHLQMMPVDRPSQWLLKYILLTVPFLHAKFHDENSPKSREPGSDPTSRFRNKGTPQDELSANHVLAERRRREKLNERFIILRSLVPFVTKMDKASILGDTIEYVKQLRRKIQDLETHTRQMETERVRLTEAAKSSPSSGVTVAERARLAADKRKVRVVEGSSGSAKAKMVETSPLADMLQVSIIESDALIELQCPYKEGLLLDVMLTLRELRVEVTTVQSSMNNGFFTAELRAKVKENVTGKKASIIEVKRAISQIVPHTEDS